MGTAVHERMSPRPPDPSFRPAGTDVSEPDTSQTVASDAAVVDAERDPLYGDRVHEDYATPREILEARRIARLSRWQEQR